MEFIFLLLFLWCDAISFFLFLFTLVLVVLWLISSFCVGICVCISSMLFVAVWRSGTRQRCCVLIVLEFKTQCCSLSFKYSHNYLKLFEKLDRLVTEKSVHYLAHYVIVTLSNWNTSFFLFSCLSITFTMLHGFVFAALEPSVTECYLVEWFSLYVFFTLSSLVYNSAICWFAIKSLQHNWNFRTTHTHKIENR